ncbi:MAG TPA: amidohydrolase family protein [Streptosporangiaceae bacterium]|jgi:cytosine/adenosine deaminase-related metal-dependent hydrolase
MTDLVLRNGYVMTMDEPGDLPDADVHIAGGAIAAVGPDLDVPGATSIDAGGMIVLPGLVDTHWHMWNTLLRSMSDPAGYFHTSVGFGRVFRPDDVYQGTRLAAAEAIYSGITFVHDWCHNVGGPDYAAASLRALAESGLRARFSYGWGAGHANDRTIDLAHLEELHQSWDHGLLSLGLAWRGPASSNPAIVTTPEVYLEELRTARRLGLPVTVHASGPRSAAGQIDELARAGLLGPDLQIIHANNATDEEIDSLAAAGAAVSVSPFSELRIGYGFPKVRELLAAGVPTGLSIDTTVLSGNADMFAIMKVTQNIENGRAHDEFALPARRVLELATIEGARSMGMGDVIGSLRPGKRADVILVSTDTPNLVVFTDPAHLLVTAAQPANVDTVIVDGRIRKRNGALTTFDTALIAREARAALAAVRARAGEL